MKESLLVINANPSEVRVALMEDDGLAELLIQRRDERGYLGNIYLGRVNRVLPGMQAAFVEIGEHRSAFLYAGDVIDSRELARRQKLMAEDPSIDLHDLRDGNAQTPIDTLLSPGQQVVVQVVKEPIGTKGARVSMFLSLPGRYLVLLPNFNHIGISRRITDENDRQRLKQLIEGIKPPDCGVIIRTAALEADEDLLRKDVEYLTRRWLEISKSISRSKVASAIYREAEVHIKALRDLYTDDVSRIVIDDQDVFEDSKSFLEALVPGAGKKIEKYSERTPIFDAFGIEVDIARALSRKVWLPSGGYLMIDQTEALTTFDVNTGKFVGKLSLRDTIIKTNLEAVHEIAAQLRLRNIGGIIVLDFIDMEDQNDRDQVFASLEERLAKDKAKVNVLKISELGLVQMTRKRTSDSLGRTLMDECSHCNGIGHVRSLRTVCLDMIRDIERFTIQTGMKRLSITVRKSVKDSLFNVDFAYFKSICDRYQLDVNFVVQDFDEHDLKLPPYEILPTSAST